MVNSYMMDILIYDYNCYLGWGGGGGGEAEQLSGVNDSLHIFFNNLTSKFQK